MVKWSETFKNQPLPCDAVNREMIGSVRCEMYWLRERRAGELSFICQIISFELAVGNTTSVSPRRNASLLRRCAVLCFALIAAVNFYDINSQQYKLQRTYQAALRSSSISCSH